MAGSDTTVRRELGWVAAWTLGLAAVMNLIFVLLGQWTLPVLWGTLLGCAAAIGNFWLMCRTVVKAVGQDAQQARATVRASQSMRLLMQGGILVLAFLSPVFHPYATLLCLFFPQPAVRLRPLWKRGSEPPDASGGDPIE